MFSFLLYFLYTFCYSLKRSFATISNDAKHFLISLFLETTNCMVWQYLNFAFVFRFFMQQVFLWCFIVVNYTQHCSFSLFSAFFLFCLKLCNFHVKLFCTPFWYNLNTSLQHIKCRDVLFYIVLFTSIWFRNIRTLIIFDKLFQYAFSIVFNQLSCSDWLEAIAVLIFVLQLCYFKQCYDIFLFWAFLLFFIKVCKSFKIIFEHIFNEV